MHFYNNLLDESEDEEKIEEKKIKGAYYHNNCV
jgi:hypothetical protein